ncbi:MAG: PAS domain-containing protein [Desulfobacterium sp.]|jgi:PAS domain S-box-containing protein|nr:PAS domain-containing protein [Desulfobacterium sp.]
MNTKENQPASASELRYKAEKILQQKMPRSIENLTTLPPEEICRLIHELEVHQIELEMQNEELRVAQKELETSRKLYLDLYDLAPVGYCVVSEKGLILKANLTAATLLGKARIDLINQPITQFVFREDQDIYYLHRKMLFETGQPQTAELQILRPDKPPSWVRMDANFSNHEGKFPACNLILTDISESKQLERALKEWVKELNFFFSLSVLLEEPGIGVDDILKQTVRRIPEAWQFPEITEACIEMEGVIYQTEGFRTTQWMQTCDILIQKKPVGQIMVCCLDDPQTVNGGPFLKEEHYLIASIAERIGHTIDRIRGGGGTGAERSLSVNYH